MPEAPYGVCHLRLTALYGTAPDADAATKLFADLRKDLTP